MAHVAVPVDRRRLKPTPDARGDAKEQRLLVLERLVLALEDELSDEELTDEQKLQNIGERLAQYADDRDR
jgi:hypothetical protein